MAGLSNTLRIPAMMRKASLKYVQALNSVNYALEDPVEAKSDQTLMIVILLGLYEKVQFFFGFPMIVMHWQSTRTTIHAHRWILGLITCEVR